MKEIVSFRGGAAPSALQPEVGSERNLESTNHVVAAASSLATPIDRRELRAAVGDLLQCMDLADDEAVQSSASKEDSSATTSAKAARIMRALALEDASTCCALFLIYSHIFVIFHTGTPGSGLFPPKTSSKRCTCWKPPSNQRLHGARSRLSASLPASSPWSASAPDG